MHVRIDDAVVGRGCRHSSGRCAKAGASCEFIHVIHGCRCTGCVNAPLPAESQTAKRTHFLPAASKGILNFLEPKAGRSVAEMICVWVESPSPQTSSTNSSGKVHSTSALYVRCGPVPSMP